MNVEQCGHCNNNIRINIVKFPGGINDRGGIIIECSKCKKLSFLQCRNPSETSIILGGHKIDCWDDEVQDKNEFLEKFPTAVPTKNGVLIVGDLPQRSFHYNFNSPFIHYCNKCGSEVESLAQEDLKQKEKKIDEAFGSAMNYILACSRRDYHDLIVTTEAICKCQNKVKFNFHAHFKANGDSKPNYNQFSLVNTSCGINTDKIDGIASKTDCLKILEKFLLRWSGKMNKIIIATPFVGHQWMSDEEIIDLWDWIKNYVDQDKTTLITRTATLNKYKKACKEKSIDIELLSFYGINDPVIEEMTKKQDFHAKIYIGINDTKAEILSGSFNILDGNSVENISYKECSIETLMLKYIHQMNIKLDTNSFVPAQKYVVHIQEKDGEFTAGELEWF